MKTVIRFLLAISLCVLEAHAQTAVISGQVINTYGQPLPNAQVRVCPVTSTGSPCSPLATIYYDYNRSLVAPNPYPADQYGNYTVYVGSSPSPNLYTVEVYPKTGITWSYVENGPFLSASGGTITGDLTVTGVFTASNINAVLYALPGDDIGGLCASFAGNPGTVVVTKGITVATNTSTPPNCGITALTGGRITVTSGTLTINGPFSAPPTQTVFAGSVAGLSVVRPEWFGGTGQAPFLAAYNACVATGCQFLFNAATYVSPFDGVYQPLFSMTKPNIKFIGAKTPLINSTVTALENGTIIQRTFNLSASGQEVSNLGVDSGSAVYGSTNACGDGLDFTNSTGSGPIPNPMVSNKVEHVVVLLCSTSASYHGFLSENTDGMVGDDLVVMKGIYNFVIKSSNIKLSKLRASGSNSAGLYIKSDTQYSGPLTNISVEDYSSDSTSGSPTAGVAIEAQGEIITGIHLRGLNLQSPMAGISIQGDSLTELVDDVDIEQTTVQNSAAACFIANSNVNRLLVRGFICNAPLTTGGAAFSVSANNATYDGIKITVPLVGGFLGNGTSVLIANSTVEGNGASSPSLYGANVNGGSTQFANFNASTFIQSANSILTSGGVVTKQQTVPSVPFAVNSFGYTPSGWISMVGPGSWSLGTSSIGDGVGIFVGDPFTVRGKAGGSPANFAVQDITGLSNLFTVNDSGLVILGSTYAGSGHALLCVDENGNLFRGTATTCP